MRPSAHGPLRRNRDYLVLWSGQLISVVGSRISGIRLSLGTNPVGAAVAGVVLQVGGVDVMVWVLAVGTGLLALAATITTL